jgi:hypothetical protein
MSERAPRRAAWLRALPWLVTAACFAFLYYRIDKPASAAGMSVVPYLIEGFRNVSWTRWIALMVPYSLFYFMIDSLVTWRVINWFNTRVRFSDILPIRGSAYILSIVNEQVSKGAMALYLNRRYAIPGWQVGSSMLFIMFCEFYYLLGWATIGVALSGDSLPEDFRLIPRIATGAAVFFLLFLLYFNGAWLKRSKLRDRPIFHAFRRSRAWQYGALILLRSPAFLAAVFVYTVALELFGVQATFGQVLGYLPVIFFGAAAPLPMRSIAIVLWVILFPEYPRDMAIFGLVMHNFFIFFNATIGLVFLRRASRELLRDETTAPAADLR